MKDFQDRYSLMFRDAAGGAENCPRAGSLADLAAGRAWPWRRRRLIQHLSHCSDCVDDYRVLTMARDGLVTALERQAHAGEGPVAARWKRPGLAAAAVLAMVAISVSVLLESGSRSPVSEPGAMFAGEPAPGRADLQPDQDRLFNSDFGEPEGRGAQLFSDDFGG